MVTKAYLEKLRNDSKKLRRLEKSAFGGKQYNGTDLGKSFLCATMVQNPSLSFYSFEQIIPLVICSVFADASIEIDDEGVGKSWPSANSLKSILCDGVVDVIIRIGELIKKNDTPVFIQCNKGNRKGVDHFVN